MLRCPHISTADQGYRRGPPGGTWSDDPVARPRGLVGSGRVGLRFLGLLFFTLGPLWWIGGYPVALFQRRRCVDILVDILWGTPNNIPKLHILVELKSFTEQHICFCFCEARFDDMVSLTPLRLILLLGGGANTMFSLGHLKPQIFLSCPPPPPESKNKQKT